MTTVSVRRVYQILMDLTFAFLTNAEVSFGEVEDGELFYLVGIGLFEKYGCRGILVDEPDATWRFFEPGTRVLV